MVAGADAPSERDVLADLRRILPPYALPSHIAFVETMPRTPTGKVDVTALLERATTAHTEAHTKAKTHDGE